MWRYKKMDKGTKGFLGWSGIVLAVIIALNQAFNWAGWLQYLWALLVLGAGIWTLAAKE